MARLALQKMKTHCYVDFLPKTIHRELPFNSDPRTSLEMEGHSTKFHAMKFPYGEDPKCILGLGVMNGISSIFDKCPNRLMMRFLAKPYILWKSLFL